MTTTTDSLTPDRDGPDPARRTVSEMAAEVRAKVAETGETPSRNEIMRIYRIGARKATTVLAAVEPSVNQGSGSVSARRLHAVGEHPEETTQDGHEEAEPGTPVATAADAERVAGNESRADVADPTGGVRRGWVWRLMLVILSFPAFLAIWGGWVGLGELAGFGEVKLLPGITDRVVINSAITLPIGVETYAAFALWVWLAAPGCTRRTRDWARISSIGALCLGMAGQIAYHLMSASGMTRAPWPVVMFVATLPVIVFGSAAGLAHLLHTEETAASTAAPAQRPAKPRRRGERPHGRLRNRLRKLRRDERGAVSVELVIAMPLLMLLLLAIVQFGLYLHASHIAQAAAAEGLSAARIDRGSAAAGSAQAQQVLSQLGSNVLHDTNVHAQRGLTDASVTVTGTAVQVLPFLTLSVTAHAAGPVEVFRGSG